MAGLLQSPMMGSPQQMPPAGAQAMPAMPTAPGGGSSLADPTLQRIEAGIASKVSQPSQRMFQSCVNAGMALLFSAQSGGRVMAKLKSSTNLNSDIPTGVANVCAQIYNEVGMRMPASQRQLVFMPALMGAAAVLTCHVLDVAEKLGRIKVTPQIAAQVIHDATMACLAKFGVKPQQIQQAVVAGRQKQGAMPPAQGAGAAPPAQGM